MISDNGTKYVGVVCEIKELVKELRNGEKIKRMTSKRGWWSVRKHDQSSFKQCLLTPVTIVSGEVDNEVALTPNHFLVVYMGGDRALETVDMTTANFRKHWRRVQDPQCLAQMIARVLNYISLVLVTYGSCPTRI